MPSVRIDPSKFEHLSLFGYEVLAQNDQFIVVHSFERGEEIIPLSDPYFWFEDHSDADQLVCTPSR